MKSPNFGPRRGVEGPSYIMIHYTDMSLAERAQAWMCHPQSQVSAHYLITRWGEIAHLVAEGDRAWHAGVGCWAHIMDMNSHSIGIELDYPGAAQPSLRYPEVQIASLIRLIKDIQRRWNIPPSNLIGHSDFAPERKSDPGPLFPWKYLGENGVGLRIPLALADTPFDIKEGLTKLGYALHCFSLESCMGAYAQRFMGSLQVEPVMLARHLRATLESNGENLR